MLIKSLSNIGNPSKSLKSNKMNISLAQSSSSTSIEIGKQQNTVFWLLVFPIIGVFVRGAFDIAAEVN
ncbi:hypothetical protein CYY_009446 [Polysphondylium violaceum]|uniref:Uncharacterized protein n=1 Tax=Polysphondylium violaceum TaxID=133409 RepID=A0A8J4PK64_9MYCE|nr:hypothetical protein CYY_009446 [Polysphondylium violaceum]